ncbi:MAG: c-type cytochrome [Verrucomicrobiota bacterium]
MSANQDNRFNFEASAASDDSIREVHARLQSRKPDKPHGYPLLPLVLLGLMCCVGFFGSIYMVHHSIRFDPLVVNARANRAKPGEKGPVVLTRAQLGKPVYLSTCATCHQANGLGVPGAFPPLAGSEWVAGSEERIVRIVLHGLQGPLKVKGADYNNVMAPLGAVLKDEQIANVLSYIRSEWGNTAPEVQPETVAKVRADTAGRATYWTAEELLKIGN